MKKIINSGLCNRPTVVLTQQKSNCGKNCPKKGQAGNICPEHNGAVCEYGPDKIMLLDENTPAYLQQQYLN